MRSTNLLRYLGTPTILLAATFVAVAPALAAPITPTSGAVLLEQLDFRGGDNSGVGEITVFRDQTILDTGLSSGFLNVANTAGDWLVRNLPLIGTWDSASSTSRVDLGIPDGLLELTSMNLSVDFSAAPLTSFTPPPLTFFDFGVSQTDFAAGGVDGTLTGYLPAPDLGAVNFLAGALTFDSEQKGHRNVQAALNQCAPAAVANSLDWLRRTQSLRLKYRNRPGLKGDNTLVGQLDTAMDRQGVTSRTTGSGVWPLDGKLKFISENKLEDKLEVKHRGTGRSGGTPSVALTGTEDLTRHGVTSEGKGATVTWEWILSELEAGEDVEIDLHYRRGGGRHYVNVIGAGMILGVPYIRHISDHIQTDKDPRDRKGTNKVDFEFMVGDFVTQSNATVDQALSESIKTSAPEPVTLHLFALAVAMAAGRRVMNRRGSRAARGAADGGDRRDRL